MFKSETSSGMSNSFTDLMTSLAVIFILLLCASLNNAQQEGQTTRNSVLAEVQNALKEFAAAGIEVTPDPKDPLGLLVLVPEALLAFQLDRSGISPNGELFLKRFIPRLSTIICSRKFAEEINSIVVEGHTDSSGTDLHNWDLSQRRSMSVVGASLEILNAEGMERERAYFLRQLSASGRGSAELIMDRAGEEDAASSRRVVFKIRIRSLEQKPLLEVLGPEKE
jgi:outer membrane protein OmpA-like peptidoglycan-associated protein